MHIEMNASLLISIIIPVFNRSHLIEETLQSILTQDYKNWECILIDDGSTDSSVEVIQNFIKKDERFRFYRRPITKKKGPSSCRNFGYKKSKGNWIKWFDSDDILKSNALSTLIPFLNNNFDVVISSLEYVNYNKIKIDKKHCFLSDNLIDDYLVGNISFYVCTPTWNREFLEQSNQLFDEDIYNLDDWDFNLNMLYKNPKMKFINDSLMFYRIHENSLSNELIKLNFNEIKSEFRARDKHLELLEINKKANPILLKKFIKNRYSYFLRLAMIQKHPKRVYFLISLLKRELLLFDFLGFFKTLTGFLVYRIFNRGYRLIK